MEKAYAQALWNMVKSGMAPKDAVHAVSKSLNTAGRGALLPRVGHAFAKIAQREAQLTDVTLSVAHESDAPMAIKAIAEEMKDFGITRSDLKTQVDDTLIGGWRLEGRERLVDASYKNRLLELFNNVTRA